MNALQWKTLLVLTLLPLRLTAAEIVHYKDPKRPKKLVITPPSSTENGKGKALKMSFEDEGLTLSLALADPVEKFDRASTLVIDLAPKGSLEASPSLLMWKQFPNQETEARVALRGLSKKENNEIVAHLSARVCHKTTGRCRRLKESVRFLFKSS